VIARYTRPEIGAVWTQQAKLESWLEVELAATEAWAEEGVVPAEAAAAAAARTHALAHPWAEELPEKLLHILGHFSRSLICLGTRGHGYMDNGRSDARGQRFHGSVEVEERPDTVVIERGSVGGCGCSAGHCWLHAFIGCD